MEVTQRPAAPIPSYVGRKQLALVRTVASVCAARCGSRSSRLVPNLEAHPLRDNEGILAHSKRPKDSASGRARVAPTRIHIAVVAVLIKRILARSGRGGGAKARSPSPPPSSPLEEASHSREANFFYLAREREREVRFFLSRKKILRKLYIRWVSVFANN